MSLTSGGTKERPFGRQLRLIIRISSRRTCRNIALDEEEDEEKEPEQRRIYW
jgi:hypothetical protein